MINCLFALLFQAQAPVPAAVAVVQAPPAPSFVLEVLKGNKVRLEVGEEGAPLADIVKELTKQLNVPVSLSRSLRGSKVKTSFTERPLEEALGHLASKAYLDYRATSGRSSKTTLTRIALQTAEEAAPALPPARQVIVVVEGIPNDPDVENLQPQREAADAQSLLEPPSDKPYVRVMYQAGLVTLRAYQRTPAAIGGDLAERLGVSFTLNSGVEAPPVDLEILGAPVDDLARWLPDNMSVVFRKEAATGLITPLGISMGEPLVKTAK